MSTMTTTQAPTFVLHNDRAHRATCRRVSGDAPELLGPEAVQLAPASCCKPDRSPAWRLWLTAPVQVVYRSVERPRAKHFWIGSGRDGAAAYAAALGCELTLDNRTYTVEFTGARADEAAELVQLAWDAAADQLPSWRTSREPDSYRSWPLRDRLAADREYMRSWHVGAAGELGVTGLPVERGDAAALGSEWARSAS